MDEMGISAAAATMTGEDGDCVYLTVKAAKSAINQSVSLVAAVLHRGPSQPSRESTDYFCILKIIDSSCHEFSLPVKFFGTKAMLPFVQSFGDIIRLRDVMIRFRNEKVFAIFKKEISSFAIFKRDDSRYIEPYQVSKPSPPVTVHDKAVIKHLETWLIDNLINAGLVGTVLPLSEIQINCCVSLVCKILHFSEFNSDNWMLYVWDGTDCPFLTFEANQTLYVEHQYPLQLEPVSLPRSVSCIFPPVGSVLRVIADQPYKHFCGKWVKLRRIIYKEKCGIWFGEFIASSEIVPLSSEDEIVISRQRCYGLRQAHNLNRIPQAWFDMPSKITYIAENSTPFSTLMDVLTHSEVTYKYRCVARFIASQPGEIERLTSSRNGKYRIRFTLEDSTARIRAGLFHEDGEKFFGGYLHKHELTRKMNILLGITDGLLPRNPPLVELCLISFYQNKNEKWGSRKFRIINTTLTV